MVEAPAWGRKEEEREKEKEKGKRKKKKEKEKKAENFPKLEFFRRKIKYNLWDWSKNLFLEKKEIGEIIIK
jgi:hypothetical protein